MKKSKEKQVTTRPQRVNAPLQSIRAEPWAFIGLAAIAGVAAGIVLKVAPLRKVLKIYGIARRVV